MRVRVYAHEFVMVSNDNRKDQNPVFPFPGCDDLK